jgi:hypothetical protein
MFRKPECVAFAVILAISLSAGCGRGNGRLGLSGSVRLDGAPIDGGAIQFVPATGPILTTAGALIVGGRYTVAAKQGLLPGTYRVSVFSPEPSKGPGLITGVSAPPRRERIPERYNVKSELTVEVRENTANRFDFDLTTSGS